MGKGWKERQAVEEEQAGVRKQVAAHKNELEIAVSVNKARREWPDRQIRRTQKRWAEVEARLAISEGREVKNPSGRPQEVWSRPLGQIRACRRHPVSSKRARLAVRRARSAPQQAPGAGNPHGHGGRQP